jgi:hypothetical protein
VILFLKKTDSLAEARRQRDRERENFGEHTNRQPVEFFIFNVKECVAYGIHRDHGSSSEA